MRTRLLASIAALAVVLLPATANAATVSVTSSAYATPVQLSWDVTAAATQTVFRAPGACSALPMGGQTQILLDAGATLASSLSDAPGDGVWCYYVQDDGLGYGTAAQATVDTTDPSVTLGGVANGDLVVGGSLALSASASDTGGSGVASVAFEYRLGSSGAFTPIGSPDTSAPYGASFTTSGLPTGSYEIHAIATDAAGNTATDTATGVVIDNTHPSVTLGGVSTGAHVTGTLSLSATASDTGGSGLSSVAFAYRLGSSGAFTPIGSPLTTAPFGPVPLNTLLLGDGTYQIEAVATDGAGNTTADIATGVLVDTTPPSVTLSGVATSAKVHGTLSLSATATDAGSGVASVAFEYRLGSTGAFTPIGAPDTTAPYGPVSLNTALLADGTYEIHAIATDNVGNPAAVDTATGVLVDNTAPAVVLSGVATSAKVHGTLSLSATATDAGSGVASVAFEYRLGSTGAFTPIGAPDTTAPYGPASFNTALLTDGTYEVHALATDVAGNQLADTATTVVIDNTPPPAPSPAPIGLPAVSAAPTITFNAATDALSGTDHYEVWRGATLVGTVLDTALSSYTFSDSALTVPPTPTSYSYTVKAVDKAGNTSPASAALSVLVDGSGATTPASVAAGATPTTQRPQLSWTAPPSPGFTVDHYKIYRAGAFLQDVIGTTFTDSQVGLLNGSYTYQIVAASSGDAQVGIASAPVAVMYDTTAPTAPGATGASAALDGSISISWAASSDGIGSGVARYVVRRALSSVAPATVADGDAVCQGLVTSCTDSTALNGKLYTYAVFAVDGAGNTSAAGVSAPVTARDQLAPAAPTGLAATPGDTTVALRWAAAGDDVAGYVLVAKPGAAAPASDTDGTRVCGSIVVASTSCTATGLTNGATYTFGLFALDEALNRSAPAVVTAVPNGPVTDVKPPAAVKGLSAKISGRTVTLTWKNPADKDFDHVEITASVRKPSAQTAAKRVYSGKGTKATTTLAAGASRWFVVVAYDRVGNASTPASVRATIAPASPFGPAPKAKVHGAVKLSWPVVKGARYYNVQLFAGSKRVLASWPAGHALQLPKAKLKRGAKYTWYVWPGLGVKAKAHYGTLIGKSTFTYLG